jgi:FtsH-binding integral membrane protein
MEYQNPFGMAARPQARTAEYDMGLRKYLLGIYNYMASALALTGIVALLAAQSPVVMGALYLIQDGMLVGMKPLGWVVMFAPVVMALVLGFGIPRMSVQGAQAAFWAYAALMGLSLSSIFMIYTGASIARVFFITAGMFGGMSLYGYTTKRDLTGFGSFLIMGVWGLILASVVNMWLKSPALYWALSLVGVGLFLGLTAYDTQKLKGLYYQVAGNAEAAAKTAILGALTLYLDFINLFIMLLRFFGERR